MGAILAILLTIVAVVYLFAFGIEAVKKKRVLWSTLREILEKKRGSPVNSAREILEKKRSFPGNSVRKEWGKRVNKMIDEVGIRERVDCSEILDLVIDDKVQQATQMIARWLGLPVQTIVVHKSEVNRRDGRQTLAQVGIPEDLPQYGLPGLMRFPITITTYDGYDTQPNHFIYVIAHELCHILLHSLRYTAANTEEDEENTDLAVLLMGFVTAFRLGRSDTTSIAGYLSQEQFDQSLEIYEKRLLAERENYLSSVRELKRATRGKDEAIRRAKHFDIAMRLLISHKPTTKLEDSERISELFARHSDAIDISKIEKAAKGVTVQVTELENWVLYNKTCRDMLAKCRQDVVAMEGLFKSIGIPSKAEIELLDKYTGKWITEFPS